MIKKAVNLGLLNRTALRRQAEQDQITIAELETMLYGSPPSIEPERLAEICTICYTSELREEPSVQLSCGHIFHTNCIKQRL